MSDQKKESAAQLISDEQLEEVNGGVKGDANLLDPQIRAIKKQAEKIAEKMARKTLENAPTPFIAGNTQIGDAENAEVVDGDIDSLLQ